MLGATIWQSSYALVMCQVIRTNSNIAKPCGILWHKLSPEKLSQIRILRELKERIENETGSKLPTGVSAYAQYTCQPCAWRVHLD